jgi:thioredoxin reductase (NADPH)
MKEVIIIGGGPAGVSAALYTARAGCKTLIIHKGQGALAKAELIGNFYGQATPPSGMALVETGLTQARQAGAETVLDEVTGISLDEHFTVETVNEKYTARAVILATGASRSAPSIPGLTEYEGKGVSYCAVCDAFFYKGKDVAVLGGGAYALREAGELLPLVNSLTVLTHGKAPEAAFNAPVITEPITKITGEKAIERIHFKNGDSLSVAGLFIAVGVAGGTELAMKIGAVADANGIAVDNAQQTSIPGLFAAGDCVPGMKQIAKAVYDGALAGTEAVRYLRE